MPAVSLTDLQQQIVQRERELQALRQELESRQSHLSELTRRKEDLQSQLRQVEEEIAALAAAATLTEQPAPTAPAVPLAPPSAARAEGQPRLGEWIVILLRESAKPMTARQLIEEAQRRGYQSTSQHPVKAAENRLQDLKSQGVVRRAPGRPGFILASSTNDAKMKKSKASQPTQASAAKTPSKPAKPGRRGGQPPLRVVLTDILKNSRKPLSGSELAQRALAAGYKTESTKFVDSVWSMLGQMKNVEHLPQQGYRLKKS